MSNQTATEEWTFSPNIIFWYFLKEKAIEKLAKLKYY